ncbi:hypothetical protein DNTS_002931 [Danionella cerebrum]|uniref:Uncharacterized protein n=1 Tax=Danionella cerebrum TaxID=2873325 RepID=A0A553NIG5_9TELE|nr:hypothetical protein DNTS_002931 [Danionella translucida]
MLFSEENQVSVSVWTDSSSSSSASSSELILQAAVPPGVQLGLTVLYTVLYLLLFVFVYLQLWLILHYGHKRFSYQSVFLFLCLLWSALRTTLFSFYFKNVIQANQLQPVPFWLLYCFPVCLQFFTLCLLNLYFAQHWNLTEGPAVLSDLLTALLYAAAVCISMSSAFPLTPTASCCCLGAALDVGIVQAAPVGIRRHNTRAVQHSALRSATADKDYRLSDVQTLKENKIMHCDGGPPIGRELFVLLCL